MDKLTFRFQKRKSEIFGVVYRPIAKISFWSNRSNNWIDMLMIVDTDADYTLLPKFYAMELGINFKDCVSYQTMGIGGKEKVYLFKKVKIKLGNWERKVPVGFLDRDDIPPLLGRQNFLETFDVLFSQHITTFSVHG